jgi:hypothetical protein
VQKKKNSIIINKQLSMSGINSIKLMFSNFIYKLKFYFIIILLNILLIFFAYQIANFLSKRFIYYKEYEYKKISINLFKAKVFNSYVRSNANYIEIPIPALFKEFFEYFNNTTSLTERLQKCPLEIIYDERNIFVYNFNWKGMENTFDVLIKSYENVEEKDINKCFKYIFVDELNKFYLDNINYNKNLILDDLARTKNITLRSNEKINNYLIENQILINTKSLDLLYELDYLIDPTNNYQVTTVKKSSEYRKVLIFLGLLFVILTSELFYFFYYKKKKLKYFKKFFLGNK